MPRNAEREFSFAELLAALRLAGIAAWKLVQAPVTTAAPSGTAGPEHPRLEINPYQVLRIQRSATLKEIHDAHCLMRKLNFYGTVREPLAIIDLAHDLLKDPESRREVDDALRHGDPPAAIAPPRAAPRRPLTGG